MIFKREVSSWDHPRRCGENRRIAGQLGQLRGSPPQVRGKPRIVFKKRRLKGITPAGAGKTFQQADKVLALEDHPRRCGENGDDKATPTSTRGSPPQVRGKPHRWLPYSAARRITPAGAGKTLQRRQTLQTVQDHPRRCGENKSKARRSRELIGSPPQVRGKLVPSHVRDAQRGITPAGAGKTTGSRGCIQGKRDHPRRCGENGFECRFPF